MERKFKIKKRNKIRMSLRGVKRRSPACRQAGIQFEIATLTLFARNDTNIEPIINIKNTGPSSKIKSQTLKGFVGALSYKKYGKSGMVF